MNPIHIEYFNAIGMEQPLVDRVSDLISLAENIWEISINDILITNYPTEEGRSMFEHLWMVSDSNILEAKNFISETDIDIAKICKINYIRIKTKNYNFSKAENNSTMTIRANTGRIEFNYKAYQDNCDFLYSFFKKYIKPNIDSIVHTK